MKISEKTTDMVQNKAWGILQPLANLDKLHPKICITG